MATKVKAKDLREGDKIVTPDGTYTVVRNRQVKTKIPARYVKQQKLLLEYSSRRGGVAKKRTDLDTAWDTTEYEIMDRHDFKSRYDRFMRKHNLYINAFAATVVGAVLTVSLNATGIANDLTSAAMLLATLGMSCALTVYAWRNS